MQSLILTVDEWLCLNLEDLILADRLSKENNSGE